MLIIQRPKKSNFNSNSLKIKKKYFVKVNSYKSLVAQF